MISSGANFLGALKNVARKIWSTVITEEDKDKKVSGREPGLGTPEHLRKSSRASPAPSQIILDAWAMNITGKSVWGGQTQPIAYQSAALRKSDSMQEKGNLVSMATKVWKKSLEINVIFPCVCAPPRARNPSSVAAMSWVQQPPGERDQPCCSKQLHLLWNNSVPTWRKPHTRQRQAGIWRGGRNLQNKFQTIQSRAVSSSMSVKAQPLPRGEQNLSHHFLSAPSYYQSPQCHVNIYSERPRNYDSKYVLAIKEKCLV